MNIFFFFSSRRRHTSSKRDWSSDVCSSDLPGRFPSLQDIGGRHAETLHVVHGQVDPVLACVLADVADDVGELECDTEVFRILERARIAVAEDLSGEQADDARDVVAIMLQRSPVEITGLGEIHFHPVDDLVQARRSDTELLYERRERTAYGMLRLAGGEIGDLGAPPRELRARHLHLRRFVDHIVHFPAEGVERRDGAAPLCREEQERVVEARAARGGLAPAVLVGRHIARASSKGQSNPRSTGRRRNTSQSAFSIFFRIRSPPWMVARISSPTRPGRALPSALPESIIRRVLSTWKRINSRHASSHFLCKMCCSVTPCRVISSCGR